VDRGYVNHSLTYVIAHLPIEYNWSESSGMQYISVCNPFQGTQYPTVDRFKNQQYALLIQIHELIAPMIYDGRIGHEPLLKNIDAWIRKENALDDLKYNEAIKFYDKAIEIDPGNAKIWWH
jgi:hypothetical protein